MVELARVLTPENRDEVLPRFFLLSKREAKEVSAEIRPVETPPRRDVVTGAGTPAAAPAFVFASAPTDPRHVAVHPDEPPRANAERAAAKTHGVTTPAAAPRQAAASAPRPRPETVEPLTAEASRLHVTVSRRFLAKLEAARAALSHSLPGAGAEELLGDAATSDAPRVAPP